MRHVKVTYINGDEAEGDQRPFDTVEWERHFEMAMGAVQAKIEVERGRLELAGVDPEESGAQAANALWLLEYDLFYAYAICRRLGLHQDKDFDAWGAELASIEWSMTEETADPLGSTQSSGS